MSGYAISIFRPSDGAIAMIALLDFEYQLSDASFAAPEGWQRAVIDRLPKDGDSIAAITQHVASLSCAVCTLGESFLGFDVDPIDVTVG